MADTSKGKVLVIGGGCFIGSHTADALSDAGYEVSVFDMRPSPYIRKDQKMIIGDILDTEAVNKAVKGCRYVYHFAGIADIEEAKSRPIDTVKYNILGTAQILEAARLHKIERFVFASTVYVYSGSGSFYRASKQACEAYIESYQEVYGLPYTILRYGSLYGRRAGPTNGIHRLIQSAIEDGEIVYEGDPDAMREYIHASDAARLSTEILSPDYENRHLIITGQERMRVTDLMRMVAEMIPGKPPFRVGEKKLIAHYTMTPYTYNPKLAHKLTSNDHIDLGQGILDCISELYDESRDKKEALS
jgi:UDP-glucose 4-epimerase